MKNILDTTSVSSQVETYMKEIMLIASVRAKGFSSLHKGAIMKEISLRVNITGKDSWRIRTDNKEGKGVFKYSNGDSYEGDFVKNKKHG
jgi:hypothetical protein